MCILWPNKPIHQSLLRTAFISVLLTYCAFAKGQCSGISVVADTNESCAPGIFQFKVLGAPAKSLFSWDFGKGHLTGEDTFRLIEPNPKKISLTLYTFLASGSTCTTTVNNIAEVYAPPKPAMAIGQKVYCNTEEAYTVTDKTPNAVFRIWTVEGVNYGDTSNTKTAKFSTDGKKTISLMVEDKNGCRAVKSFPDIAEVISDKSVDIKGLNTNACVNQAMQFSLSTDLKPSDIQAVYWQFPNAFPSSSTDINPSNIRYAKGGRYNASVEVKSNNGCTYNHTSKHIAYPRDSVVLDIWLSDSAVCTPHDVHIIARNKDLVGPLTFDVNKLEDHLIDSISHIKRIATINTAGVYDVLATYQDTFCTSHFYKKDAVEAKQVFARISSSQHYDCEVPFLAKLNDNSQISEAGKVTYRWLVYDTLGNLITASAKKDFEFVVKDSGMYDVELTVRHENGCADSTYSEKFIRGDSIRIDFDPVSEVVCLNQDVLVQNNSLKSTYKVSDFFVWKLYRHGDTTKAIDSSYSYEPIFNARYDDSYDLKVFAYNSLGCTQEEFRENVFKVDEPTAGFRVEQPYQCPNDTFSLISEVTPAEGEYTNRWYIYNQSDTIKAFGRKPVIEIPNSGLYSVEYQISIFGLCQDTSIQQDTIGISGIVSEIILPTNRACGAIPIRPLANIKNHLYGVSDTTIQYNWAVLPNKGYSISNDAIKNPEVYFTESGDYILRLISINASGCRDTAYSDTIHAGLNAKIEFIDTAVCANTALRFNTVYDSFVNKLYYNVTPTASYKVTSISKDSQQLFMSDKGSYSVEVIASRDSICFDTSTQVIKIVSPTADFYAVDSNLYCAPVYQRFRSTSTYADTFFWDFGDGKNLKTTFSNVTTVYEQNTGDLDAYTVRLIAKNKSGCSDTLVKNKSVKVKGPAVQFELVNYRGCEPLEVKLKGKTDNVYKMYIDYGDGEAFGYSLNQPHYYTNSWRIIENTYTPVILVVDKNGCQTAVKSDSSVYVKPSPTAKMDVKDSIACAKLNTRYYYVGNEATSWYWDFEGDGTPDGNGAVGLHRYQVPGRYPLTLINSNAFDCHDTAVTNIHVVRPPSIQMGYDSVTCITKPFQITDLSEVDTTLKSRLWTLETNGTLTQTDDSSFVHDASVAGLLKLKLHLVDSMNCASSDSVQITVRDSSNSGLAQIEVVSVNQQNFVDILAVNPDVAYQWTNINRVGSEVARINANRINYQDSFANVTTQSVCYMIFHEDSCGFESKPSTRHCTVHLSVASTTPSVNELTWTPYVGWANLNATSPYQIWRTVGEDTELLAEIGPGQFTYADSFLSDKDYCYTVVAQHQNGSTKSSSNAVCSKPIYLGNNDETHIKLVTVRDNQYIHVEMESDTGQFILVKQREGGSALEIQTDIDEYDDYNVDVQQHSYVYGVKQLDHCGSESKVGRLGKSIVMQLTKEDVTISLRWNAYHQWLGGVKEYRILRNSSNGFVLFKTLSGNATAIDFNVGAGIVGSNCFKIAAVSETGLISESNETCITGEPIIFIPNAFSPFDHAVNDFFKPYTVFIKSPLDYADGIYDFNIYDKWGGLLFHSNDPIEGWDGTYNAKDLPEGVYVYTFRVKGLDDKIRNYSGSVTLVR